MQCNRLTVRMAGHLARSWMESYVIWNCGRYPILLSCWSFMSSYWWTLLYKPIGWNFATSGSSNLHIFNNKIVAVSDTDVCISRYVDFMSTSNLTKTSNSHFRLIRTFLCMILLSLFALDVCNTATVWISWHSPFTSAHSDLSCRVFRWWKWYPVWEQSRSERWRLLDRWQRGKEHPLSVRINQFH